MNNKIILIGRIGVSSAFAQAVSQTILNDDKTLVIESVIKNPPIKEEKVFTISNYRRENDLIDIDLLLKQRSIIPPKFYKSKNK